MSVSTMVARLASSRRASLFVVLAGVLLTATSLAAGFSMDDHLVRAIVRGQAVIARPAWDAFHFLSADPAEHAAVLDRGLWPWFTAPGLQVRFFRPLSSLSAVVDYRLLPDWPWLFHLESMGLYAMLIALVLLLYRAVLPRPELVLLGALLFAIDDAHGWTVGWLANRSALFAAVFGMAAVLFHDRALRLRWWPGFVLGPVSLALAFASAEAALGAFGYLVAYALVFDVSPLRRRLVTFTPYLVVVVAWALVSRTLGFGVRGSGSYVDPANEPLRFLSEFPARASALLVSQLALPSADIWNFFPDRGKYVLIPLAVAVVGVAGWVIWGVVGKDRGARFLALGSLLALVPVTGALASDRNLLLVGVGAFGLIAMVIGQPKELRTPAVAWVRGGLIGVHCVLAPLLLPVSSVAMGLMGAATETGMQPMGQASAGQTAVLVNAPMSLMPGLYLATPRAELPVTPARVRALATSDTSVRVRREDDRTLLLTPARGNGSPMFDAVFRAPADALKAGDRVSLPGTTWEVVESGDSQPKAFRCRFEVPLEDASLRWFTWDGAGDGRFVPFKPPSVGAETIVGTR